MQLISLAVSRGSHSLREVTFKNGLNLILDAAIAAQNKSGNDVGKTTVLRLIDYCLGSSGADIWQDPEFKNKINQPVYDFLHGTPPVTVSLVLSDPTRGLFTLSRTFDTESQPENCSINGTSLKNVTAYRADVKVILFGVAGTKPSLRQLVPKFVRSSPLLMAKTLRFLGDFGSETAYEAIDLFLFGFFAVQTLEERARLIELRKKLSRDHEALNRLHKEGELAQLLYRVKREIEELMASSRLRAEVPFISETATAVAGLRADATRVAGDLAMYASEAASIQTALRELKADYAGVDDRAIEAVYKEADRFVPNLHHEWNEAKAFVERLRGRKERYLASQLDEVQKRIAATREELTRLRAQEQQRLSAFSSSPELRQSLETRAELQEKLKEQGSLEQSMREHETLKALLADTDAKLEATRQVIEAGKQQLQERVAVFNGHFTRLSKLLYGEEYLLHVEETERGSQSFQLMAIGSNVGSGKKVSQTAAFDIAYIEFLNQTGINFPKFVCHDGIESVHDNPLAMLLDIASKLDGQLILATLRDKLPPMPNGFLTANTVIELSQTDKFFGF